MINCWALGRKVVRVAHRAIHKAVHRVRHHYHSPVVKIVAPAIVCVSTGAGLAPWLASAPPISGAEGVPAAVSPSALVPLGGGMFVGSPAGIPAIKMPPAPESIEVELAAELANLNFSELIPSSYEFVPSVQSTLTAPPTTPSPSPASVPEPSTLLLFSAALSLLAVIRFRFGLLLESGLLESRPNLRGVSRWNLARPISGRVRQSPWKISFIFQSLRSVLLTCCAVSKN
jgi:hypothetical protein